MTREELLQSNEYWITQIQMDIAAILNKYMVANDISVNKLSHLSGYKKGFIKRTIQGDFDGDIESLVALAIIAGYVPIVKFEKITDVIENDKKGAGKV